MDNLGLDRDDDIDRLKWQQRPRLPLMTELPTVATATGIETRLLASGLEWVA